jgi:NADH:ubiquinone oxidoreductase subunit 5 (subunit L)/multisubunit Na+/H+ antiporter MnhA subunit
LGICSFALRGIPFLSAFYSKDKIIEERFSGGFGGVFLIFFFVSIILTIMYSFRLVKFIVAEGYDSVYGAVEDSFRMLSPISCLTLGGIFGGCLISWLFLDLRYDNLFFSTKRRILFILFVGLGAGITLGLSLLVGLNFRSLVFK